jgi:hypothetical protein
MVIMMTKKKTIWFGFTLIALLVVAGIAFADELEELRHSLIASYARSTEGALPNAAAGEAQVVSGEKATVRLTEAVASGSHTVVEFLITDFTLPADTDPAAPVSLHAAPLLNGDNLQLSGFTADTVLNASERREAGAIRFALELPPLAGEPAPATITFTRLQLMVDDPVQQRAETVDLGGPWTFRLSNQTISKVETRPIEKRQSSGPVTVVMTGEIQLSESETLIPFRLETPPGMEASTTGAPQLQFDGQTFGGQGGGPDQYAEREDATRHYSFPALPSLQTDFTVEIGPFLVTHENPVQVILDVKQLRNGGQVITVQGHSLRFVLTEGGEGMGFELRHEPADEADAHFMVKGKSYQSVQLVDDQGQTYTQSGGSALFEPEPEQAGRPRLKSATFRFAEPLNENASQLILTSETTGELIAPVQVDITAE